MSANQGANSSGDVSVKSLLYGEVTCNVCSGDENQIQAIENINIGSIKNKGKDGFHNSQYNPATDGKDGVDFKITVSGNVVIGEIDVSGGTGGTSFDCFSCIRTNGGNGGNGGTVKITSLFGDIAVNAIYTYGGLGGNANNAGSGGNGGSGGDIILTANEGRISVFGNLVASGAGGGLVGGGDIRSFGLGGGGGSGGAGGDVVVLAGNTIVVSGSVLTYGGGGAGGQIISGANGASGANASSADGGQGGLGGTSTSGGYLGGGGGGGGGGGDISLISDNDVIVNGQLNSSGGGGGGGAGTAFGGVDGVGGNGGSGGGAGNISVSAGGFLEILHPVLAAGGAGGGGGGTGGGSGGGGGSFGAGGGGAGIRIKLLGTPVAGGIGSGGGGFIGGNTVSDGGDYGLGGHSFDFYGNFLEGGNFGMGGTGANDGGNGGKVVGGHSSDLADGQNGLESDGIRGIGGKGGQNGDIFLQGSSVALNGTVGTSFSPYSSVSPNPFSSSEFAAYSLLGERATVKISAGQVGSQVYDLHADFSSTTRNISANILPVANSLQYYHQSGVTVPGVSVSHTGIGTLRITEGGNSVLYQNGDQVTPAEWVALVQAGSYGGGNQTLVLSSGGDATSGDLYIADENLPESGFTTLLVPEDVTAFAEVSTLQVNQLTTVTGKLSFETAATILTPHLIVDGTLCVLGDAPSLTVDPKNLTIEGKGQITLRGIDGGSFTAISEGDLFIKDKTANGTLIDVSPMGASNKGGSITLEAAGKILISSNGGNLDVSGSGDGDGGDITISAGGILQVKGAGLTANSNGSGNGGNITLVFNEPDANNEQFAFLIGGNPPMDETQGGVGGNIFSRSVSGTGGKISISNTGSNLVIQIHQFGHIGAQRGFDEEGNGLGLLSFISSTGYVSINGKETDAIAGKVETEATSISIDVPKSILVIKTIGGLGGDVDLAAEKVLLSDDDGSLGVYSAENINVFTRLLNLGAKDMEALQDVNVKSPVNGETLIIAGSGTISGTNVYAETSGRIEIEGTPNVIASSIIALSVGTLKLSGELNTVSDMLQLGGQLELTLEGAGKLRATNKIEIDNRFPPINTSSSQVEFLDEVTIKLTGSENLVAPAVTLFASNLSVLPDSRLDTTGSLSVKASSVENNGLIKSRYVLDIRADMGTEAVENLALAGVGQCIGSEIKLASPHGSINAGTSGITFTGSLTAIAGGPIGVTGLEGRVNLASVGTLVLKKVQAKGTVQVSGDTIQTASNAVITGLSIDLDAVFAVELGQNTTVVAFGIALPNLPGDINLKAALASSTTLPLSSTEQLEIRGETPSKVVASSSNIILVGNNVAISDGGEIKFDHGQSGGNIKLGGNVKLLAIGHGLPVALNNLDFSDPETQAKLIGLQVGSGSGDNTLEFDSNGAHGNITIDRTNIASSLSSLDIPELVSVTLSGYGGGPPLDLTLSDQSSQANIAGTLSFVSASATDLNTLNVISGQSEVGLNIASTGTLSGGSNIAINSAYISNSGTLAAEYSTTISTMSMTNNGTITATMPNAQIVIQDPETLIMSGNGVVSTPAGGTISVIAEDGNSIRFTGSYVFDPGQSGTVLFQSTSGSISFAPDTTQVISSGTQVHISAPTVIFEGGTSSVRAESGVSVLVSPPSGIQTAQILSDSGPTASISTNGGSISFINVATIGSVATPFGFDAAIVAVTNAVNAYLYSASSVQLQNASISGIFQFASQGSMSINGSVSASTVLLQALSGGLAVSVGSTLSATEGDLTLQNLDTIAGSILIGQNTVLSAATTGSSLGHVNVAIGTVPSSPIAGSPPANTNISVSGGGHIYFGLNGISDVGPSNVIDANGGTVVFNTGSLSSSAIQLGGNVDISAQAVSQIQLTSLDLTDTNLTSQILSLQASGLVGGTLQVSGGIATGGNLIVTPSLLSDSLSAARIPANVTITFQGFQIADPINIDITSSSHSTQVVLAGTTQFVSPGSASSAVMNITSNQAGPVLVIANTGLLSSDGGLAVTINGSVSQAGNITASGQVSLTITSGSITRTAGAITGSTVSLSATSGSIGTSSARVFTNTPNLILNTLISGNAFISNTGSVSIANSSVIGTLNVKTTGTGANVTVAANLAANIVYFNPTGNFSANSGTTITVGSSGSFTVIAQGSVTTQNISGGTFAFLQASQALNINGIVSTSAGGTVTLIGSSLTMPGSVNVSSAGMVNAYPIGSQTMSLGGTGSGQFNLTDTVLGHITANTIYLGQSSSSGSITISNGTNVASYNIQQFNLQTGGSITNAGSLTLGAQSFSANAQVNISSGSISSAGLAIILAAGGALNINGAVSTSNNSIVLQGASLNFTGSVNAGQGSVIIRPSANIAMAVGDASGTTAPFDVTAYALSNITAGNLTLGDLGYTGGLTIAGDINVSGTAGSAGVYNLAIYNGGSVVATGRTINLGNRTLNMQAGGSLSTGTVVGGTGTMNFLAGGTLAVDGAVTNTAPGSLTLFTGSNNGNILLGANVGGGSLITVTANGSGSITQSQGIVTGTTVSLRSTTGSIGTSAAPIQVSATTLTLNTGGTGAVYASSTGALTLGTSTAGGNFNLSTGSGLTVGNISTVNGSISLTAGGGALAVQANKTIYANEGNITLRNSDATSGTISIGANATVWAHTVSNPVYGFVTIVVGEIPAAPVQGTTPANVVLSTTDGGQAYFGTNGITANGTNNKVNAWGRNVVFSTGDRPASAITLGGGTTITADPPPEGVVLDPPTFYEEYEPIAFTPRVAKVPRVSVMSKGIYACSADAQIVKMDDNGQCLQHGEVLISAQRGISIKAGDCVVEILPSSLVLISKCNDTVTVRDVSDQKCKSVKISTKGWMMCLNPGQEIMVAPSRADLVRQMKQDKIARRRIVMNVSDQFAVETCDFSHLSIFSENQVMKLMRTQPAAIKKIIDKANKSAACLYLVTSQYGPFSIYTGE